MQGPLSIAKKWMDAMNAHDTSAMERLYSDSVRGLEVADPPEHDREGLKNSYTDLFAAYPDCRGEVLNAFEGEGQALIEMRWVGTNTGSFRGEPPTNKVSDLQIAYIFHVTDGKITRMTEYYDSAQV